MAGHAAAPSPASPEGGPRADGTRDEGTRDDGGGLDPTGSELEGAGVDGDGSPGDRRGPSRAEWPRHEGEPAPLDSTDSALLDTLVREAPLGFALYDSQMRYRRINRILALANGLSVHEHLGRRPSEVLGELGAAVESVLERVLVDGSMVHDDDFVATDPEGRQTRWQSQWFPVRTQGRIVGVAVFVSDVTARRRTEDALRAAYRRGERLLAVTTRLARALTLEQVATVVSEEIREGFGALGAGLALVEAEQLAYVAGPGMPVLGEDRVPLRIPAGASTPTAMAMRFGRPVYVASLAGLREFGLDPDVVGADLLAAGERSWAWIPLNTAAGCLGVVRVAFGASRVLPPEERVSLEAVTVQSAVAVERALLYDREHATAQELQRSLLPDSLPRIPGVALAARYLPATPVGVRPGDPATVGGDWYDAFVLPSGRLAIALGDVMGKGVRAAAGMGRVRSALRALAFTDESPAAVLSGLDRVFTATEDIDQIVTLVYAVIDPASGDVVATSAGHPPALLAPAGGAPRLMALVEGSMPLGMPEPRAEQRFRLGPGDSLVLFSDGLVETREGGIGAGLEELVAGVAPGVEEAAGGPAEAYEAPTGPGEVGSPLDELLERVIRQGVPISARRDDVTLFGIRL